MEQKFHCALCKSVGGRDARKFKCVSHKFICSDCITTKGFFTTKYTCNKCDKETIGYEWDGQKKKWQQM